MKTLKFWDKTELMVTDQQWNEIRRQRDNGVEWVVLQKPYAEFNPKSIAKVVNAVQENLISDVKQLPNIATMTDEQRRKNRQTIARMKRAFLARKAERVQKKP